MLGQGHSKCSLLADVSSYSELADCAVRTKTAFTLAEVLITLGVIGVVAAMTLPSLIENHKKKETVVQLKKNYSMLNQAMQQSEIDNGPYDTWEVGNSIGAINYFNKYWRPYLKVLKICKNTEDCNYGSNNTFWKQMDGEINDHFFSNNGGTRVPMILADGIFISIFTLTGYSANSSQILVDLNGAKGPNKFGRDVFWFIREQKKGIMPLGYDLDEEVLNNECSIKGKGLYCAAKIMRAGWEIMDDYPW